MFPVNPGVRVEGHLLPVQGRRRLLRERFASVLRPGGCRRRRRWFCLLLLRRCLLDNVWRRRWRFLARCRRRFTRRGGDTFKGSDPIADALRIHRVFLVVILRRRVFRVRLWSLVLAIFNRYVGLFRYRRLSRRRLRCYGDDGHARRSVIVYLHVDVLGVGHLREAAVLSVTIRGRRRRTRSPARLARWRRRRCGSRRRRSASVLVAIGGRTQNVLEPGVRSVIYCRVHVTRMKCPDF